MADQEAKVVAMPGVSRQSVGGMTVDETLKNCLGRYDRIVVIGRLPDGSHELNSPLTCEQALFMIARAHNIVMG
jgi:hypothetical protein